MNGSKKSGVKSFFQNLCPFFVFARQVCAKICDINAIFGFSSDFGLLSLGGLLLSHHLV